MPTGILRYTFFLSFLLFTVPRLEAGCVDSIHIAVHPVKCHGLRNGIIEIAEVYGGVHPFYFSLDGQTYSTRPVFDLLWAGEYNLYVKDSTGCVVMYPVLVPEPEELRVKITVLDSAIIAGEWVQVKATVYPPDADLAYIEWRPSALFGSPNQLTQYIRLLEDTDLAITVRNTNGCIARDMVPVQVEKTNLYFPNVFSPGSTQDNYFTLFAGEGVSRVVSLQVFDRTGNMVYEGRDFLPNDPLQGWNGKWRGRRAPDGVYPWVALIEFLDGSRQRFSGNVTLING
ncbi:MAG: hypothetical protein EP344_03685 [Bacteroidetes bacterium]|nr:MAG: hypothetical protein EP344_03685 [Bacteroidota bacterium]